MEIRGCLLPPRFVTLYPDSDHTSHFRPKLGFPAWFVAGTCAIPDDEVEWSTRRNLSSEGENRECLAAGILNDRRKSQTANNKSVVLAGIPAILDISSHYERFLNHANAIRDQVKNAREINEAPIVAELQNALDINAWLQLYRTRQQLSVCLRYTLPPR